MAPRREEDVKQSNVTKKMRLWVAAVRLNVTNAELLRRSSESICSSHLIAVAVAVCCPLRVPAFRVLSDGDPVTHVHGILAVSQT